MARAAMTAPGNLPATVTSFVGRHREISRVREALTASRLVTLSGTGGVGKTRLALESARRVSRAFADGVWVVDLTEVSDPGLLSAALATALSPRDHAARSPEQRLVECLADRQALVVLDNCEHVVEACAEHVDLLLRACPRLRVLATSRHSLEIGGERVLSVPPLTVPPLSVPSAGAGPGLPSLLDYEAVSLLVERAGAVDPGFEVTPANAAAVAELCRRLDGIPLAIELAATRLRTLSVSQLADRLADRFEVLGQGNRSVPPRQRTLRALIDSSYELCTPQERLLWARLSVFAGGFDLDAAEAVCAGEDLPRQQVLHLLDQLVAQSVLVRSGPDGAGRPRLGLLETIREYGWQRLGELGERDLLRDRHRDHFLGLARSGAAAWCGPGQEETLARLRADHANLQAAFERCRLDPDGAGPALQLAAALRWHWCADGFLGEGRRWLDAALSLPGGPGPDRAEALWVYGWVALLQGDREAATTALSECLRLADGHADGHAATVAAAQATGYAGTASLFGGDLGAAITHFRRGMAALEAAGETGGMLHTMFQLAVALSLSGDHETAAAIADRARAISMQRGDHLSRSYALWAAAFGRWLAGDSGQAHHLLQDALRLQAGFRDSVGVALMIETLSWVTGTDGDLPRAASLLGAAASVWRSIGTGIEAFGPQLAAQHVRTERELVRALRADAFRAAFETGGRPTVEDALAFALPDPSTPPATLTPPSPGPAAGLTSREQEVAALVAEGLSNREIAQRLVVSPRTIDGHVQKALAKLGFRSRAQIATWVSHHLHLSD